MVSALGRQHRAVAAGPPRGFEVSLLLRKAPSTALTLRLPVSAGGLSLTQAAGNGDLSLTDPSGRIVARAPAPTMCAASTDPRSGMPNRIQHLLQDRPVVLPP